ncbi:MAG: serine/threonine protein kinase with sensor(s) [Acidimicrobiaceae bacterium]|nr:serine/threonine protein kinase with sensor(s) [Acidimicrobiaceae bacterium]
MTSTTPPVYNERYELRNQIARGGTAQVYLARDLLLDRPVALKVLFPELSADHAFVERFRREAQAAANLSHPNIVPVFDWGEADRTHFIVMEYVDGEPLSSIIRTQAPLAAPQAASIAADIAKALSYAHRHGVVHRDVKPGNVLITADGVVKVTDFGIARAMGADTQVTQTGLVMGTATYFSPEQAQGFGVDGRSDVYALGVVLYEMLVGRPPFTGESPVAIAYQHVREVPPTPRSLNPSIPPALEAIVLQAMAKQPGDRYATADDLRVDLERFIRGQAVAAHPPAVVPPPPATTAIPATAAMGRGPGTSVYEAVPMEEEYGPRRTTVWWALAAVLLLVAIGVVAYFGGRALGYFGGTQSFAEPDVHGMVLKQALSTLKAKGLDPVPGPSRTGTKAEQNQVFAQVPAANSTVRKGQQVTLSYWTYKAPPKLSVPNVSNLGLTAAQAESTLSQAGFKANETFQKANSPTDKQGTVVGQSVKYGTKVAAGSVVTIKVVSGSNLVTIPTAVVGQNQQAAAAELKAEKLVPQIQADNAPSTVPAGDVVNTNPAPGTSVKPGTAVVLQISTGGAAITSVVGLSASAAEAQLQQDGLSYRIAGMSSTQYPTGAVGKQFPAPGVVVRKGYPVVLFVVGGKAAATTTSSSSTSSSTTSTTSPSTTTSTSTSTTLAGPPSS